MVEEKISEVINTDSLITKTYPVDGMTCASCAVSLESYLRSQDGIEQVSVSYPNNSIQVIFQPSITPERLSQLGKDIGYNILTDSSTDSDELEQLTENRLSTLKKKLIVAIVLSVPVFIISMFIMTVFPWKNWLLLFLSIPVIAYSGSEFYLKAFERLKYGKANMDTLVALSTGIAFIYSLFNTLFPNVIIQSGVENHVYYESAVVIITLILLGRYLEEKAKRKTSESIKKLLKLTPDTVPVMVNGNEQQVNIKDLAPGDLIVIKPGARIPVDGRVKRGESYVDESMINGEPVPVRKERKSKVWAGTINQLGNLNVLVDQTGESTVLGKIINAVKEAQASKPPIQDKVDQVAAVFVPGVILIALISSLTWFFLGPEPTLTYSFTILVSVLIIACPCALGLATPMALMAGIGKGADMGILIKDATSLQNAEKIKTLFIDKTGTLTEGAPRVTDMVWYGNEDEKSILKSLEEKSEHPLSNAITQYHDDIGLVEIIDFKVIPGMGIIGKYNEDEYFVGNRPMLESFGVLLTEEFLRETDNWIQEGKTIVYFGMKNCLIGVLGITDNIKTTSYEAVKELKELGIELGMLTGDNERSASIIGAHLEIDQIFSEVSPLDKKDIIERYQSQNNIVAMTGDGINDSAALAKADVSIAMSAGSDIAIESSDITLVRSNLLDVPRSIKLSKATMSILRQNLFWAFIYNIIAIPIAAGVIYPFTGVLLDPMIAGAAMAFSSLSVVLNSLRLKTLKL